MDSPSSHSGIDPAQAFKDAHPNPAKGSLAGPWGTVLADWSRTGMNESTMAMVNVAEAYFSTQNNRQQVLDLRLKLRDARTLIAEYEGAIARLKKIPHWLRVLRFWRQSLKK